VLQFKLGRAGKSAQLSNLNRPSRTCPRRKQSSPVSTRIGLRPLQVYCTFTCARDGNGHGGVSNDQVINLYCSSLNCDCYLTWLPRSRPHPLTAQRPPTAQETDFTPLFPGAGRLPRSCSTDYVMSTIGESFDPAQNTMDTSLISQLALYGDPLSIAPVTLYLSLNRLNLTFESH